MGICIARLPAKAREPPRSMRWCQRRCKRTRLGPGKTLTSAEQMRPLPTREWDRDLKSVGRQQVGREHTPRRERGKDLLSGSTVQPDGRDVVSRATLSKCFSARPDQYTVLWPDLSSALFGGSSCGMSPSLRTRPTDAALTAPMCAQGTSYHPGVKFLLLSSADASASDAGKSSSRTRARSRFGGRAAMTEERRSDRKSLQCSRPRGASRPSGHTYDVLARGSSGGV